VEQGDAEANESHDTDALERHRFTRHPYRAFGALAIPVFFSQLAEPLTGIVDTAFIARLGAAPLTALGVATMMLSSVVWIFNFLAVGTQTEVAKGLGTGSRTRGREATGLALTLSALFSVTLAIAAWPCLEYAARFMSPDVEVQVASVTYLEIRLLGLPGVLLTMAAFGALRGTQDMTTPLWIALGLNAMNAALDALLIFGLGPVPALGIAGAAWAATVAQWFGAGWALVSLRRRIGWQGRFEWRRAGALLVVGRDLFLRTGLLLLFLLLATRAATRAGVEAGAAHQAIRQIWMLAAFMLGAFEVPAQSLVAFFLAGGDVARARQVAAVACRMGVATGALITIAMLLGSGPVAVLLVPESARPVFAGAWIACALSQPLNALSFVTDGVHWGTGDYTFIRNAMFAATGLGALGLATIRLDTPAALTWIWIASGGWIVVRAGFGVARIWPGIGGAPLRAETNPAR
jgi:MATE family multidrug resistance protein